MEYCWLRGEDPFKLLIGKFLGVSGISNNSPEIGGFTCYCNSILTSQELKNKKRGIEQWEKKIQRAKAHLFSIFVHSLLFVRCNFCSQYYIDFELLFFSCTLYYLKSYDWWTKQDRILDFEIVRLGREGIDWDLFPMFGVHNVILWSSIVRIVIFCLFLVLSYGLRLD